MRRFVLVLVISGAVVGLGADGTLGVGMQFTVPAAVGVSVRYWSGGGLGVEGTAFLFSSGDDLWGVAGGRALIRLARADLGGFYLAFGGTYYVLERVPALGLCGGIDLALPFARSLTVNAEFGFLLHRDAGFGMAFGAGIHFYFPGGGE